MNKSVANDRYTKHKYVDDYCETYRDNESFDTSWLVTDMNWYEGGPIFMTVDQKNNDNLLRTAGN